MVQPCRHTSAPFITLIALTALAIFSGCKTTSGKSATPAVDENAKRSTEEKMRPVEEDAPAGTFYVVKKGDTLWAIANAQRLPVEELVEVNGLEGVDFIAPGQIIFIPDDDPIALARPPLKKREGTPPPTKESAPVTTTADLMWPIDVGVILREFSKTKAPYDGLLFAAPAGTPIAVAAAGKVLYVGDEGSAFGTMIIVEHKNDLVTVYAHLDGVDVEVGENLKRGSVIGRVGSSGRAESPQLHFQVRDHRVPVNPLSHLPPP